MAKLCRESTKPVKTERTARVRETTWKEGSWEKEELGMTGQGKKEDTYGSGGLTFKML